MKRSGSVLRCLVLGFVCLAGICCLLASVAAAETAEQAFSEAKKEYGAAMSIPQPEKRAEALKQRIQDFQKIAKLDADGKLADKSLYLVGQCYHRIYDLSHKPEDLSSAVDNYRSLIQKYPSSPLADDAQYLIGVLYIAHNPDQAYIELSKVALFYPKGDMRTKADQKLAELKKRLRCEKKNNDPQKNEPLPSGKKQQGAVKPGCPILARLDNIQRWSGGDYTRVVLYTSAPVNYQVSTFAADPKTNQPARIYLNLKNCVVNPTLAAEIHVKDELLQEIRAEQCDTTKARVILEAQGIGSYRAFSLPDPSRLIVDMRGNEQRLAKSPPAPQPPHSPKIELPPDKGKSLPSLAQQLGLDVKTIVLDPGHGGKDKGAISPNGTYEKDIVLNIAQRLKKKLEDETGCEVFLTRNSDEFLSLEERTAIANAKKADLFISIHTNANEDRSFHGTETYFLNLSKDKESARVAALENATSAKRISDLEAILHNLMLNTKINESTRLAKDVQSKLVNTLKSRYNDVRDLGTKQAPFYVLLGAEMPSILIETAFLTNETEEHRLKDKAFQETLADGMADGIRSYIQHVKNYAKAGIER